MIGHKPTTILLLRFISGENTQKKYSIPFEFIVSHIPHETEYVLSQNIEMCVSYACQLMRMPLCWYGVHSTLRMVVEWSVNGMFWVISKFYWTFVTYKRFFRLYYWNIFPLKIEFSCSLDSFRWIVYDVYRCSRTILEHFSIGVRISSVHLWYRILNIHEWCTQAWGKCKRSVWFRLL